MSPKICKKFGTHLAILKVTFLGWSGQNIATSHDRFPPKGSFLEGKSRLVKYYNLARMVSLRDLSKGDGPPTEGSKGHGLNQWHMLFHDVC